MPYQTPQPHQIHFVLTPDDGAHIYATKFLPVTNSKGSRLKFWRVNSCLEMIGTAKTVSWDHEFTGQAAQLRAALGTGYTVLEQYEALKAIGKHFEPTAISVKQNDAFTSQLMNATKR